MWKQELSLDKPLAKKTRQQSLEFDGEAARLIGLQPGFTSTLLFQHSAVEFQQKLEHRGGGRGYFATEDIYPGELILSEYPGAEIPSFPEERDPSERCLLNLASMPPATLEESREFLANLSLLHPQSLQDISPQRLVDLKQNYSQLLREMQTLPNGKLLGLDKEDVLLRHVAALHFNGFTTGVYLYLAMVNHSCAPNCIKWGARDAHEHSEVRSTRLIKKGEEITFSYLVPLLRSRKARQRALSGQFGFDCQCELCSTETCPPELESGSESAKETLELALEQVEAHNEIEVNAKAAFTKLCKHRNEAKLAGGLGPRSLALAHADVLILECCLAILDDANKISSKEMQFFIMALLTKAFSIRKTQLLVFKINNAAQVEDTNSESETTLQHISSGIGYFLNLMNGGVQILTSLRSDDQANTWLFANKLEAVQCQNACVRTSKAIAALYL